MMLIMRSTAVLRMGILLPSGNCGGWESYIHPQDDPQLMKKPNLGNRNERVKNSPVWSDAAAAALPLLFNPLSPETGQSILR